MRLPEDHALFAVPVDPAGGAAAADVPSEALLICLRKALGHELPNHFTALQGLVRILEWEEKDRLSDEGKSYLARLAAAAERGHGMVRTLADLLPGRRAGRAETPVAFSAVAREAGAEAAKLFPEQQVEYHIGGVGVHLPVSGLALRQVLVQLIRNGIQATPRGAVARITLEARAEPAQVTFWVTDRGHGLSADQLRLLEGDPADWAASPGRGFGLLFVRLVVESWGGRLRLESRPGEGCTVTVTVPTEV